jgi:hypothetical protein
LVDLPAGRAATGEQVPMTKKAEANAVSPDGEADAAPQREPKQVREHIVEIVSDSGEGAQKAGQTFGTVSAKMSNGVWTVEIIPAEIKPPSRSRAGASGIRIRVSSEKVTNMGDEADLVVAFNEQVLYGRIQQKAFGPGTIVLTTAGPPTRPPRLRRCTPRPWRTSASRVSSSTSCLSTRRARSWSAIPGLARTCSWWACSAGSTSATYSWP